MEKCWISPTVLPDHFLFNEPRMFTGVSERINPFPTHTPKGIPFIIPPNSNLLNQTDMHKTFFPSRQKTVEFLIDICYNDFKPKTQD